MPPRRRYTRRGQPSRWLWEQVNEVRAIVGPGNSTLTDMRPQIGGVIQEMPGLKVAKVEGNLSYAPNAPGFNQDIRISAGMMRVTQDAFFSGNVPRPDTENPAWSWNKTSSFFFIAGQGQASQILSVTKRGGPLIQGIDNLFMMIIRNVAVVVVDITINLRVLYKLP